MKQLCKNLACLAALAGAAAAMVAAAPSAQAATPPHLYVCITGGKAEFEILRYRLRGGFPVPNPDRVYSGVLPPMTIGNDGTLYANVLFPQSYEAQINVYPPDSNVPSRTLYVPSALDYSIATALAAGPEGFLYVGYVTLISGASPTFDPSLESNVSPPYHGIAVFGPNANGQTPPLTMYKFAGIRRGPLALTMGPERDLYAVGSDPGHAPPDQIYTIAAPWQGPNVISRLVTSYTSAIAFSDQTRDLYTLELPNQMSSIVSVYHRGAHGNAMPFRTFTIPGAGSSLAIVGDNIFANTDAGIFAYPKNSRGSPSPIFSRLYPGHHTIEVIAGP